MTHDTMTKAGVSAFVLEPFDLPLGNAREFGEVRYVYERDAERPSIWSKDFVPHVLRTMEDLGYDPSRDYLVVVGHQVPLVLVIAAMAATCGVIKLLLWSASERRYVPRQAGN